MRRALGMPIAALALALLGALARDGRAAALETKAPVAGTSPCAGATAGTQQTVHHAGLVVVFPDRLETRCIEFSGDDISGADVLRQLGLPVVFSGFGGLGGAVCRIADVGCSDPGNCFCQCQGADCHYWSYFTLQDGTWRYENIGPTQHRLHDGDTDAWVWGSGHQTPQGARPPCPTATPSPSTTPQAVATAPPVATEPAGTIARPGATPSPVGLATSTPMARETPAAAPTIAIGNPERSRHDEGSGPPAGLMAFGAVAGALVLVGGGVAWRRRGGG